MKNMTLTIKKERVPLFPVAANAQRYFFDTLDPAQAKACCGHFIGKVTDTYKPTTRIWHGGLMPDDICVERGMNIAQEALDYLRTSGILRNLTAMKRGLHDAKEAIIYLKNKQELRLCFAYERFVFFLRCMPAEEENYDLMVYDAERLVNFHRCAAHLPYICWTHHPKTGELLTIHHGEKQLYKWDASHSSVPDGANADSLNADSRITAEQAAAMLGGALLGWFSTAADPESYDSQGQALDKMVRKQIAYALVHDFPPVVEQ